VAVTQLSNLCCSVQLHEVQKVENNTFLRKIDLTGLLKTTFIEKSLVYDFGFSLAEMIPTKKKLF
jgi:hypothetical protein